MITAGGAEALGGDEVMGRTNGVLATEATHGQLPEPFHQVRLQLEQTRPAQVGIQPGPYLLAP